MRTFGPPPSLEELDALARAALTSLPPIFAGHLRDVVLLVEDFADEETLRSVGLEEPFELTGIYEGVPLGDKSVEATGGVPDRIRLFRRPILDEWADGGERLEVLVRHVLIHEVGHHFGLSDDDMHAIEEQA
ncbi:metallopeptidase family protein [Sphingomonas piscis]|uniref:Metallopeptidase family protein n=1 Tax=Sphingomonas piscis TaxID=2714943 RepID=A0A6G7YQB8_9SPHN|nr:metallopeptidase family protein [Sphingomonas piscis]QIK78933.1 metallopeptidase family protein [Sphingomonas piscis]